MSQFKRHTQPGASRGSVLVEFAVISPLLIAVMVGAIDLGRAYYESINIAAAAHAGAHYGTFRVSNAKDLDGIKDAVYEELLKSPFQDDGSLVEGLDDVSVDAERYCTCPAGELVSCDDGLCDGSALTRQVWVRVAVGKDFTPLIDIHGVPETIALSREVRVRAR